MHINTAWWDVDTALSDMGGTLFDLAFDNYFWQKLVLETWDAKNGVIPQEAMEYTHQQYHDVQHTLNWYCLDYQSEQLGSDICAMTTGMGPRAVLCEDTASFLEALRASGKQRILFTNTYSHSLAVELEYADLDAHLDLLLSTHTSGYPKEDQRLWHATVKATNLKAEGAPFTDDSETILDVAMQFGTRYYLGVTNPDSGVAEERYQRYSSLNDHRRLISSLM